MFMSRRRWTRVQPKEEPTSPQMACCDEGVMKKKPLIETNPYLKDLRIREEMLIISVDSSTAIEGVHIKRRTKKPQREKEMCKACCDICGNSYADTREELKEHEAMCGKPKADSRHPSVFCNCSECDVPFSERDDGAGR